MVSKTAPSFTDENIDESIRHADVKSGERKNTHVTLMKKKVGKIGSVLYVFGKMLVQESNRVHIQVNIRRLLLHFKWIILYYWDKHISLLSNQTRPTYLPE